MISFIKNQLLFLSDINGFELKNVVKTNKKSEYH